MKDMHEGHKDTDCTSRSIIYFLYLLIENTIVKKERPKNALSIKSPVVAYLEETIYQTWATLLFCKNQNLIVQREIS